MLYLLLSLQLVTLAVAAYAARKSMWSNRIARETNRKITRNIERAGLEVTRQLESLDRLYLLLDLPRGSLPASRGWAASPDFLVALYEQLDASNPAEIIELGSGLTTLVTARYLQQRGNGRLHSLDHDKRFAATTRQYLERLGLHPYATIWDSPLEEQEIGGENRIWYRIKGIELPNPIGFITVDGPPTNLTGSLGRYPVAPALFSRLSAGGKVMFDDSDRPGEKELIEKISRQFSGFSRTEVPTEKGCVVLTRD